MNTPDKRNADLHVCHIIHDTQVGGTETMLYKIVKNTHEQLATNVISLMGCGPVGEQIRQLGVPLHTMECVRNARPRFERLPALFHLLRRLKPDVVQTWGYHADLVGGVVAKLMTRAAIVWNIRHATLDPKIDSRNVLRSARLCATLSRFVPQHILSNSHAAIESHKNAGYDAQKISVIANGFDTDRFKPLPSEKLALRRELGIPVDAKVIGMCGRFHRHKGQDAFVRAARRVAETQPSTHFLMAGKQCDEKNEELASWIKTAGLEEKFHLLGVRTDIPLVLSAMDVYLLPSITEGLPNVVGEAMACGVPVVATDVGDAARLIGNCGIIVPVGDVDAMARGIERTLGRSDKMQIADSRRARSRIVNRYRMKHIVEQYRHVWSDCHRQRNGEHQIVAVSARTVFPASLPKIVHFTTKPRESSFCAGNRIEQLERHGFEVHLFAPTDSVPERWAHTRPMTIHDLQHNPGARKIWNVCNELQPEVIHIASDYPSAAVLATVACIFNVPVRIAEAGVRREQLVAKICNARDRSDPTSVASYYTHLLRREGLSTPQRVASERAA